MLSRRKRILSHGEDKGENDVQRFMICVSAQERPQNEAAHVCVPAYCLVGPVLWGEATGGVCWHPSLPFASLPTVVC